MARTEESTIVDTYGGWARHGGGLPGKTPAADRFAAYFTRG